MVDPNDMEEVYPYIPADDEDVEKIATKIHTLYTEPVSEGEIETAASEWEKGQCCDKDHPFLKEYVNEDFVAGVKWLQQRQVTDKWIEIKKAIKSHMDKPCPFCKKGAWKECGCHTEGFNDGLGMALQIITEHTFELPTK